MSRPVALLSLGSLPDSAMGRGARKVTPIFAVSPVQPIADIITLVKVSEIGCTGRFVNLFTVVVV